MLSEHAKTASNPTKQKWLFLTLTGFDKDDGEDLNEHNPNDASYQAKDNNSDEEDNDDGLKYLGMEPGARRMVESVYITCKHQWDFHSSWVKEACKGLHKAHRIEPEGLTNKKRDCTAILVQILKQANIKNIFPMGSDAPEDPSLQELWQKTQAPPSSIFTLMGRGCQATVWESRGSTVPQLSGVDK